MSAAARDHVAEMWPTGHSGWVFSGLGEFEGRVASFLAQGIVRNEQLLFVSDDPRPEHWPAKLLASGVLQLASISDVYGTDRLVDPVRQRANFTTVLEDALDHGFTGIRVAADNTSLVETPEQLMAWEQWEHEADRFMAENPVTGLCGFDRTRSSQEHLIRVVALHSTLVSSN